MWRVEEVREEEEERVEMLTVTVKWLVHPSLLDTRYVLMASEHYGVGQKWEPEHSWGGGGGGGGGESERQWRGEEP